VLEQIISKTDGVPLFVEELTKTVLELGLLEKEDDRYILSGPLPPLAIPSTLQDSLMARLDRLEGAKEIGQIGATVGREFSHALLEAVSPLHDKELDEALAALVESGIVFRRGVAPNATYVFKHALIQDAAYEALLHSRRREIHARIAEVLQSGHREGGQSQPEVLAHHYTEAGLLERAAPLWLEAGQRAVARSANHEAMAHLSNGLSVLGSLPRSKDVCSLELDMHISLGTASIAARGYSSVETEQAYVRGRELLDEIGDDPRQFAVLHGLSLVYLNQAKLQQQLAIGEEMFCRAASFDDPASSFIAHRVMAVTQNARGRFAIAREHAERAAELYDPDEHRNSAHQFGHDQQVSTYWNLSVALMFLGFADASSQAEHRASAVARKLEHANTTLYNSLYTAFTSLVKRDWARARRVAESMIEDAAARSMALWVVFGRHHLGSALATQGESETALTEIYKGRDEASRLNHSWLKPMTLRFEAQALAELGRIDEALSCLDEGERLVSVTEEHWWESEIHRFRGELNQKYNGPPEQCEASFVKAIDVARSQESKLLELRAATSLGRLWRDQGKHEHAQSLVAPICDWFSDGFDTVDLRDAKALLDELS
jgi:tetratricopeptide (TPR) repeat protein